MAPTNCRRHGLDPGRRTGWSAAGALVLRVVVDPTGSGRDLQLLRAPRWMGQWCCGRVDDGDAAQPARQRVRRGSPVDPAEHRTVAPLLHQVRLHRVRCRTDIRLRRRPPFRPARIPSTRWVAVTTDPKLLLSRAYRR